MKRRIFWALAITVLAVPAFAQTPGDGGPNPADVHVRLGPFWMTPTISMPNIGIDTNVFNDPLDVPPKRDFTIMVIPRADLWLRMGRTWLFGTVAEEIVWYQKYESERAVNDTYTIGWKAALNRLVVMTSATRVNTNSRPGFEIDERAERREPVFAAGVEIRGFAKTFIGVRGSWGQVRFAEGEEFNGVSLEEELDRDSTTAAITVRHELTPLTSVTFSVGRSEERFDSGPSRDSTSSDFTVGLSFDPAALIKGSASVGYTIYEPEAADLSGYRGSTAQAGLTYTLLGSTRVSGTLTRDVEFSYDVNQPYYLLTGGDVSIAQQIFGPVDVVVRFGAQRLHYETRAGADVPEPDRVDHVKTFGGGVGIRLGQQLRLGFNVDKERRTSVLDDRQYKGLRYGSSITYGL